MKINTPKREPLSPKKVRSINPFFRSALKSLFLNRSLFDRIDKLKRKGA